MDWNISGIQKPLTIISIFAGIVQISGIAVLPYLDAESQARLIWFLISFPVLLVVLFFITINYYISINIKSQELQKVSKSEKDFKSKDVQNVSKPEKKLIPTARYEVVQKKKDEPKLVVQPNINADSRHYVKTSSKEKTKLQDERHRRINKSSGNAISWK